MKFILVTPNNPTSTIGEATPVCGEDFCDSCGDCLACNGSEPCTRSKDGEGAHVWVKYQEDIES